MVARPLPARVAPDRSTAFGCHTGFVPPPTARFRIAAMPSTRVHLIPAHVPAAAFGGGAVAVIDVLRASTVIVQALRAGAGAVAPCGEPSDARRVRDAAAAGSVVLGGERACVRIEGFGLGNSPGEYTPSAVAGRTVAITTTNGTAALLHARGAGVVLVACLNNLDAAAEALDAAGRDVHLLCAGTHGVVSMDDVLVAGALAGLLEARGVGMGDDDTARLARWVAADVMGDPERIRAFLHESRGGRQLVRLGLGADIDFAAAVDTTRIVPTLDPVRMLLTAGAPAG